MSPGLRVALYLMAVFVAAAIMQAFLPLWLVTRGLTPAAVGQVLGLASILRVFAVPLWGEIADRLGRIQPVLIGAAAATVLGTLLLVPIYGFWPVLIVSVLQGFASSALMPLVDALSLGLARDGKLDYGRIRASGSAAYMLAVAAAGPVVGALGAISAPLMMAGCYVAATAAGFGLPRMRFHRRSPNAAGTLFLLRHRAFMLTLLASCAIQASNAVYYSLSTLHWRSHGISGTAIGLLWAEGVLAEVLLFVFAGRVTARLSPAMLTTLAVAGAAVRWSVSALTTDVATLALVQWLHMASYGLQHLSAMQMLTRTVPLERAATAQTLLASAYGTSTGLAMWIAGLAYTGTGTPYFAMTALALLALTAVPGLRRAVPAAR